MSRLTVAAVLEAAASRLRAAGLAQPRLEAEVLLAHLLGTDGRVRLWREPEAPVAREVEGELDELCRRRAAGEPSAYLTGQREFWSLPLAVDRRVLVPRPETEHLVETALARLPGGAEPVVDFGTGSGCVALALASERPELRLIAVDRDPAALAVAGENARRLGLAGQVLLLRADGVAALGPGPCLQGVVSNPPYVPAGSVARLQPEVREHEPRHALTPGPDGLELTRAIVADAASALIPGGLLALEVDPARRDEVVALLAQAGWEGVQVTPDLEGRPRVVSALRRR